MVKRLFENSMKGNCKKPVKQNLGFKKESTEKTIVCASNGKTDSSFNSWINMQDVV